MQIKQAKQFSTLKNTHIYMLTFIKEWSCLYLSILEESEVKRDKKVSGKLKEVKKLHRDGEL